MNLQRYEVIYVVIEDAADEYIPNKDKFIENVKKHAFPQTE
jgi:hypothetical protein